MTGRHRMGYDPVPEAVQPDASLSDDSSEPVSIESADTEGVDVPEVG